MNSTATTTLTKGRRYDPASLIRTGWTDGDGSGHAGYNAADFFDADCRYLGADIHGIEPVFSDESVIEYVDKEFNYRIAFADESVASGFHVVESFTAAGDEEANAYADSEYAGQEWYVLNAKGENINGDNDNG